MIECNPEMVAVAFHGGMRFASPEVMRDLAAQEPEDLPAVVDAARLGVARTLGGSAGQVVLKDPNGEQFLVVTACLEYLQGRVGDLAEPKVRGGSRTAIDDDGRRGDRRRPRPRRGGRRLACPSRASIAKIAFPGTH
jgi:hypothetical protein